MGKQDISSTEDACTILAFSVNVSAGGKIPVTCRSDCFSIDPKHENKCQDFDRKCAILEGDRHSLYS